MRDFYRSNLSPFRVPVRRPERVRLGVELLEDRSAPAIVWIAPGGGEWNVAANWLDPVTLQSRTPISSDHVSLPMGRDYTCVVGVCNNVSVGSGSTFTIIGSNGLNVLGDASFGGTLTLDSGVLRVAGNAAVTGVVTLQGANSSLGFSATGTTTLGNDVVWTGSSSISGGSDANPISLSNDLLISGTESKSLFGILRSTGDALQEGLANLTIGNFGKFLNAGTYEVHGDGDIFGTFINDGTGATLSKTAGTGVTRVSGAVNLGGHVVGHTGRLDFQMGFMPSFDLDVTAAAGAVVAFDTTGSTTGRLHGTVTAAGPGRVLIDGPLQVGGGDLVLAVSSDVLEWVSSQIVAQAGTLTNTGTVRVTGVGGQTYLGTVINTGTFRHENTNSFGGGGTFHNSGTFEYTTDGHVACTVFENTGVVIKTGGTGSSQMQPANLVNLGGQINVLTGTLATSLFNSIVVGGDFHVEPGAILDLPGGTLNGSIIGSGGGVVRTRGAGFTAGAGGATFNLPPGMLQVNGAGTFNGGADGFTIAAGSDLTIRTGGGIAIDGLFRNDGDIHQLGVAGNSPVTLSGTLENHGLYSMAPGTGINGTGTFVNMPSGTFRKDAGMGNTTVAAFFSNPGGTIEVQSGLITLYHQLVNDGGHVLIGSGATVDIPVVPDYAQTAGTTTLAGGTLHVYSTVGADIQGGTLEGTGTVIGNVTNAGTVSPGASPGALNINGNYTQTASGTLTIELDGLAPGTGYDQLVVNGLVTLGGTLAGTTGFTPALGDVFRIIDNNLTDAVTGTFTGLANGAIVTFSGTEFQVGYSGGTGNDLILTTVGHPNSAPTAHSGGPYMINEGDLLTLDATASADPDGDPLAYTWDVNGDGVFGDEDEIGDEAGPSPTLSWERLQMLGVDDGLSSWDVRVQVSDGLNPPVASGIALLTVFNTAPRVGQILASTVEGMPVTVEVQDSFDPSSADTAAGFTYRFDFDGDGTFDFTTQNDSVTFGNYSDNGLFPAGVRIEDQNGGFTDYQFNIVAHNVAPEVLIAGPTGAVRGQTRTFTFTAQDVAADESAGFSYLVNWGDGSPAEMIPAAPGNGAGASLVHTYVAGGVYTINVTATDKDGGVSAVATHTITVSRVALQDDPLHPGQMMLVVGGSPLHDVIRLRAGATPGDVVVRMNGVNEGAFRPTSRVIVSGYAGNDRINVVTGLTQPVWLYGGEDNDRITSGGGTAVILGGAGDDILRGRDARDLLLGGAGTDLMRGGRGDDLMIAGTTAFDDNEAALAAIQSEWLSVNSYQSRLAAIRATFLITDGPNRTVFDDGAADTLIGNRGLDAYFANLDVGVIDSIRRPDRNEESIDVD